MDIRRQGGAAQVPVMASAMAPLAPGLVYVNSQIVLSVESAGRQAAAPLRIQDQSLSEQHVESRWAEDIDSLGAYRRHRVCQI
ncbi:uncharacterized protein ANIA_11269 [Aspergillus nidulans FGSC A4]|uniref:Uncharacterized protein n=1 Tax=Emericella nidulans (strain FGSC A4 / ATCC 38163 / CBS 112.46 / NRRL 194 / M139) TaxID=227321 RepID=C8VTH2_EMENI|nr:hypothetical protein [Aspergillus nidulans FGSC A4]CBF89535.1 TPA: hypothetical protein ANIA_11269 [Aspergillus nidulans FGSC A4]